MARTFIEQRLIIASHNPGKVRELGELLLPWSVEVVSAAQLSLPEPEETGLTFIENAKLKADSAALMANLPALADDSGLEVNALGGAPGIYSARWGGPEKDFDAAMVRVNEEIGNNPDRGARFVCALALTWPDGHSEVFEGTVNGALVWPPRGERGFGYDPMFLADGDTGTYGEIDPEKKHANSHRAAAFRKLIDACFPAA
ncbi:MAG: dITP/XTP pyrophosphatase [Alphaproteobacteria bacterium MarineAlpha11_Bin1]|nr:MAG: dITP/XTP pyrophosphatase [Alphaproteobacteria bacterium MarineAlpha11_Bin1]|tara:strand:- start:6978 stop:7580 length:603 start_codon:yes stop_codon:yes gene_type:complete